MFEYERLKLLEVYGHDASMVVRPEVIFKEGRAYVTTKSSNNRRAVDATPIQRNVSSLMRSSENAYCVDATINSHIFPTATFIGSSGSSGGPFLLPGAVPT